MMKGKRILSLRIVMLLCAAAFLVVGIIQQEHMEVLRKAVKICLECIGIG